MIRGLGSLVPQHAWHIDGCFFFFPACKVRPICSFLGYHTLSLDFRCPSEICYPLCCCSFYFSLSIQLILFLTLPRGTRLLSKLGHWFKLWAQGKVSFQWGLPSWQMVLWFECILLDSIYMQYQSLWIYMYYQSLFVISPFHIRCDSNLFSPRDHSSSHLIEVLENSMK